jgi:hypothetical protein
MKKRSRFLTALILSLLGAIAIATSPATAATQAPQLASALVSSHAHTGLMPRTDILQKASARRITCPGFYCDFINTGFTNDCFNSQGDQSNWSHGALVCRDVDESIRNQTGTPLRLYFSPNFGGAHVCLNAGRAIPDLGDFTFNSGSGLAGFGQSVENNVASSTIDGGACTNPI